MKKLFKRIAPLVLALVMVLGSCLTVSAATSLPSTDKEYEAIIEKYQQTGFSYAICYEQPSSSNACFGIYYFSDEPRVDLDDHKYLKSSGSCKYYYVTCNSSDRWTTSSVFSLSSTSHVSFFSSSSIEPKYSNFDIYTVGAVKGTDEPFFRGPERPLVGAVRGASPEEALKEVILLIPLSILFLAGCLGLRKGLRLLLTLLRRA